MSSGKWVFSADVAGSYENAAFLSLYGCYSGLFGAEGAIE